MPLRSVVHCPFNQAQTIEFVKRGRFKSKCNSKLSPSLRPRCLRNKLLWMKQQLWIKSSSSKSEGQLSVLSVVQVYIKLLFFLFPVLRAFSRFLSNLLGVPFLLYSLSKHPNPPLVSQRAFPNILISSGLCWRWQKGLLAVELLFRGHFHINATDKVGVGRWMRRWEVCPLGNFLPPSLFPLVSFLLSLGLHKILTVLILLPSSSGRNPQSLFTSLGLDNASYSVVWSSSILGPPTKTITNILLLRKIVEKEKEKRNERNF